MNYFLVDYENVNTNGFRGIAGLSENDAVIIFYSEKASTMTFGLHRRLNESKADISFQKVTTGSKNALDFQLCAYLGYLIGKNERSGDARRRDDDDRGQSGDAYYIVSADQDYAVISAYWTRRKVDVFVILEIAAASANEPPQKPDTPPVSQPPQPPEAASANEPPQKPEAASANEPPQKPDTLPVSQPPQPPDDKPLKKPDISAKEIQKLLKPLLPAKYQNDIPGIAGIIRNSRTRQKVHGDLTRVFHQDADKIYQPIKPLLLSDAEYLQMRLESVLPKKYRNDIPAIAEIIRQCKTKQAVNGELVRAFHQGADNSKPSEVYRCVKPILTDKA